MLDLKSSSRVHVSIVIYQKFIKGYVFFRFFIVYLCHKYLILLAFIEVRSITLYKSKNVLDRKENSHSNGMFKVVPGMYTLRERERIKISHAHFNLLYSHNKFFIYCRNRIESFTCVNRKVCFLFSFSLAHSCHPLCIQCIVYKYEYTKFNAPFFFSLLVVVSIHKIYFACRRILFE